MNQVWAWPNGCGLIVLDWPKPDQLDCLLRPCIVASHVVSFLQIPMASAVIIDVGPKCTQMGITSELLLTRASHLLEVEPITNEMVLELAAFKDKYQCTFKMLHQWIKELFGKRWPEKAPTCQAIIKSVERLRARLSKLKKVPTAFEGKEEKILELLQEDFTLPSLGFCGGKVVRFSSVKKSADETKELKKKMYAITRNANKRLKRKEATICKQKSCIDAQQEKISIYEKKSQGAEGQLAKL